MRTSRRSIDPPYAAPTKPAPSGFFARLRHRLLVFFARPATELTIATLILTSVTLTLIELSMSENQSEFRLISDVNYAITALFAVELTLRFVAEAEGEHFGRRFLRNWWVDLLAVVPVLILFQPGLQSLRVLRYFRLLRLARLFTGAGTLLQYVVRRAAIPVVLITVALVMTVLVGTTLVMAFETSPDSGITSIGDAFWFNLHTLLAGEPIPRALATTEGRIVSVVVMFMGLSLFATFTGTVSAFMIERLQRGETPMQKTQAMENHIILCGLGQVGFRIMEVLLRLEQRVLVIEKDEESMFVERVREAHLPLIIDDVRRPNVLSRAGLAHARAVMAVTSDDLTNLEIALDARHIRPDIRIVLRLFDERLAQKVKEGFHIQVAFSTSSLAAAAFATAAIDRSVHGSLDIGDRVYIQSAFVVPPESALAGRKVGDLFTDYEIHTIRTSGEQDVVVHWTPPHSHRIPGGCTIEVVGPFDRVQELKRVCGVTEDLVRAAPEELVGAATRPGP